MEWHLSLHESRERLCHRPVRKPEVILHCVWVRATTDNALKHLENCEYPKLGELLTVPLLQLVLDIYALKQ